MRAALIALLVAGGASAASPPATDEWLVLLRWQATPAGVATSSDRTWGSPASGAVRAPVPDWPALRLRPGGTARWRHEAWQAGDDSIAAWTPHGPALLAAERRSPRVQALTLQALPTRRASALALAWSVSWPEAEPGAGTEAQGTLTLAPGRWVTLAEWAPPAQAGAVAAGDQRWSTEAGRTAGWRLQVRAERP